MSYLWRKFNSAAKVCGDLDAAEKREWLVTNGIGGFASGTVAGTCHAPLSRIADGRSGTTSGAHRCSSRASMKALAMLGRSLFTRHQSLGSADLSLPAVICRWKAFIWRAPSPSGVTPWPMPCSKNAFGCSRAKTPPTFNTRWFAPVRPVELDGKVLVTYRDFHSTTHSDDWQMQSYSVEKGLRVAAFESAVALLSSRVPQPRFEPRQEWYRDYFLPAERARGLDDHEDRFWPRHFRATIEVGQRVTLVFSTEADTSLGWPSGSRGPVQSRVESFPVLAKTPFRNQRHAAADDEPGWLWQLVLAADQFIVKRPLPDESLTAAASSPVITGLAIGAATP